MNRPSLGEQLAKLAVANKETISLSKAMKVLTQEITDDFNYAWAWHSNIVGAITGQGVDYHTASKASVNFLHNLFDVDISENERYQTHIRAYLDSVESKPQKVEPVEVENDGSVYFLGQKLIELGQMLQNENSTFSEIAEKAGEVGLKVGIGIREG